MPVNLLNFVKTIVAEYDEETVLFLFRKLKAALVDWKHDREAAKAALIEDEMRLSAARAQIDAVITEKP